MAWMGTPHDGEIVRQRENIGDPTIFWSLGLWGSDWASWWRKVGANINMTSPGRAMKSCILCTPTLLEYPSFGRHTVWCRYGGIGPFYGAKGAALMHD